MKMANSADLKVIVKHIVDGTLTDLCRICLLPLDDIFCENIFTNICKEDKEYCVANVLELVCNIKFSETDHYGVCSECFQATSAVYKFYLMTKRSEEILNFYVDELERNVNSIETPLETCNDSLCITLPKIIPQTQNFDYNLNGCTREHYVEIEVPRDTTMARVRAKKRNVQEVDVKVEKETNETSGAIKNVGDDPENMILVIDENGKSQYYSLLTSGKLEPVEKHEKNITYKSPDLKPKPSSGKTRRKRDPMTLKKCSQCPVQYRFIAKLKEHMKKQHEIDLYYCKVCKITIEGEKDFENHLRDHTNIHRCAICDTIFKKRATIIAHLKWHEEMRNVGQLEGAHVCELCGFILPSEEQLKDHYDKKHTKKYTCYYCGRMYRGEIAFEMHIKKHEMHLKPGEIRLHPEKRLVIDEKTQKSAKKAVKRFPCTTCERSFVDERALMWHSMLHTDERPFTCDVCGRGFVSVNRRNQHAVCAHTVPTRRCPLCPALFHLRSMVNTHIKKVHLKAHKRRNRIITKHQNVAWRTEAVPIQELSVSIQNEILELQTRDQSLSLNPRNETLPDRIEWEAEEAEVQLKT